MRNLFKLALLTMLFVALAMTPALAKKKAPVDRTVIDGVTLAEVKPGSQMQPYYPATARDTDRLAEVFVSLQVLENGRVGDIDIVGTSIPGKGFEQSAQDAVKFWRFHPALKGGEAIETTTLVRLTFAPPTLRSPDGFIFVETSARNHAVAFMDDLTDRTFMDAFSNGTANHDNRSRMRAYDLPPCNPSQRSTCIYDRSEMSQFGGPIVIENPHNTPISTKPPVGRR